LTCTVIGRRPLRGRGSPTTVRGLRVSRYEAMEALGYGVDRYEAVEASEIAVMFAAVCDLDPLWNGPIVAPPSSNPEMSGASWRDNETTGGDATPGAQPRGQSVLSPSPASLYEYKGLLFDDDDKETVLAKANHRRTSGYGTVGDVQDSLRARSRVYASDRRDTDDEGSGERMPRQRQTEGSRDVRATPGDRESRDNGRCATVDDYFCPAVRGRDTGRRSDYRRSARDDNDSYRRCDSNESEAGSPVQRRVSRGSARDAERVSPRRASASRGRKQLRSAVIVPDKTTRRDDLSTEDEGSRRYVDHKGRLSSDRRRRSTERRGHSARSRHRRSRQSGSGGRRRGRGHQGSQVDVNPPRMMRAMLNNGFIESDCALLMAKVRLKLSGPTFKIVQNTIGGERKIN